MVFMQPMTFRNYVIEIVILLNESKTRIYFKYDYIDKPQIFPHE